MATSGLYEQKVVDKLWEWNDVVLGFSWSRTSYSISNNTSTISYQVYVKLGSNFKTLTFSNTPILVTIDGVQKTHIFNETVTNPGSEQPITIASDTITLTHNTDGKKTFSFYVVVDDGNLDWTLSNSGTLDDILKIATIVSAPNFTDEENPTITYNNPSGTAVTALEACISFDGSKDDIAYRAITRTNKNYTFSLTAAERKTLRQHITSGNSTTVRFYVKTTIGSETFWSYLTKTLTLVNYEPTLSPTVTDTNPTTAMLTGDINKLVRYYSNASITFGAAARKEATLTKRAATNGGQVVNIDDPSQDSTVINNIENNVFDLSATDSRGYTTSEQVHFKADNFIPYFRVTCNQTIRLNLDQTIALTVKGNYFNGSFGAQNNELTIETRRKEDGGEWSAWESITPLISDIGNGAYTLNATISGYDPSGTYEFQCRAVDKLSSAESGVNTVTLKPVFDWGKYDFNFNVPLTIEGDPLADYVIETGTEPMGTNGTWYWRKWRSGRAECYGCRNYGNMAVTTAWGGLYRSATFTQDLPSGLFVQTPEAIEISLRSTGNYGGWIVRHEESAPTDSDSGSFIVVRPASATLSQAFIGFNIIGRWK